MGAALITATQINFKYEEPTEAPASKVEQPIMTYEDKMQAQLAEQLQLPSLADTSAAPVNQPPPPEQKVYTVWEPLKKPEQSSGLANLIELDNL